MFNKIEKFNLIILGPQGSGKGTQVVLLAKKYNLKIIAPGDLAREEITQNSSLGKKIKKYVEKGILIPESLLNKLINKRIEKIQNNGVIFDAYPRNFEQADLLEKFLIKNNLNKPFMIYLKIKDETALGRLSKRLVCPKCEAIYNPKSVFYKKGVCKKCHLKLIKRADDRPEAIKKRLKIYHQETEKIIDYYRKEKRLIEINGELKINEVFQEILKKLNQIFGVIR